jgi:endonuclease/exonuclease/phosphatase (EEP) superfamily protein YafD
LPCCSNEALKVIKEQAKQQQWAADKAIMEEWAAQQEKHEAARKAQVRRHATTQHRSMHAVLCRD